MEHILDPILILLDKAIPRAWLKQQFLTFGLGAQLSGCLVNLIVVMLFVSCIGCCWAGLWLVGLLGQ